MSNSNRQTTVPVQLDERGLPGAEEAQGPATETDSASPPGPGELAHGKERGKSAGEELETSRREPHNEVTGTDNLPTPGAGRAPTELARDPLGAPLDAAANLPLKSEYSEVQSSVTSASPNPASQEAESLDGDIEQAHVSLESVQNPPKLSHGSDEEVTADDVVAREATIRNVQPEPMPAPAESDRENQANVPLASNAPLQQAAHECARTDAKISADAATGSFARFNPVSGQIDPRNGVADPNQHVQRVIEALQAKDVQLRMMLEHIAQAAGGTAPAVAAAAERIVAGFDALHHRLANLEAVVEARTRNARNYQVGG